MDEIVVVRPRSWGKEKHVSCVMSTRLGGVSPAMGMNLNQNANDDEQNVRTNRELFFRFVGADAGRVAYARQCHSNTVLNVDSPGLYNACDGLITATPSLWLAVSVADCVPIFLFDPTRHAIGAVHAGWRGTAGRIVARCVELMSSTHNSNSEHLRVFIGPSADVCCYEVGPDVHTLFSNDILKKQGAKTFLNLKEANRKQLIEAGVREENVEVHPDCQSVDRNCITHTGEMEFAPAGCLAWLFSPEKHT